MDWQHQVRLFMTEVKGLDLPRQPMIQMPLIRELCKSLVAEETKELAEALDEADLEHIAKEAIDVIYVALYTLNAYGILAEPVFKEVQRSNMTKAGGPTRSDGKQLKPTTYKPPDIASIIKAQQFRPIAYDKEGNPVAWQQPSTGRIVQE